MKKASTNKALIVLIFLILAVVMFIIIWNILKKLVEKGFA